MDPSLLDSYCPVFDIPFLGKVEKITKQPLQVLENKNNLDLLQSGFTSGMAWSLHHDDLMTFGRVRMKMSLLELSVPFNTINHSILLYFYSFYRGVEVVVCTVPHLWTKGLNILIPVLTCG